MNPNRSLVVLHDADDLACVEVGLPDALSGDVLAFDTDIHLILQDRGIAHLTPWDIVRRDELPQLKAFEGAVWSHWTQHGVLEFEGFNLLAMAEYRHISAFARLVWPAYALRRALEHLKPSVVVTFDEPPSHGLDQPVEYRKIPLLFGIFRGLAEAAGVPVRLLSRSVRPNSVGFEDQVAKRNRRTYPPVDAAKILGGQVFVLLQANRTDLLRQVPLIHELRERMGCQVVQLFKEADDELVADVARQGHFVWHESQVARADPAPDIAPIAHSARAAFDAAGRGAPAELHVLFNNPHVASHFDFLYGEYASKMAEHVRAWTLFFSQCRPRAFVANYHAPIYDVAAGLGIPCLGLSHALMMVGQPRWFSSLPLRSFIGAFSEMHRDRLVEAGVSPDRIRITGDPQSDRILTEIRERRTNPSAAPSLRTRYRIAPDRHIVLLCTGSFGMPSKTTMHPLMDWADGVRCFRDLAPVVRRHGEWAFFVKRHPRFDYPALYASVNQALPPDRQIIVLPDEPLSSLVVDADAVCVWCTVTSALVEASLADKPVMQFARALVWYDPDEWGCREWPFFWDIDALEAEWVALFTNPAHYEARVCQARQAVSHYLVGDGGSTVPRCVDTLLDITSSVGARMHPQPCQPA
jgi:hypothetical protein